VFEKDILALKEVLWLGIAIALAVNSIVIRSEKSMRTGIGAFE
jgi:hypothetical protein